MSDWSCGECYCPVTDEGFSEDENIERSAAFDAGTFPVQPGCEDPDCRCHVGESVTV